LIRQAAKINLLHHRGANAKLILMKKWKKKGKKSKQIS